VADYCATHDKTFREGGACPGCDPAALGGEGAPETKYCGAHDKVYSAAGSCPGCISAAGLDIPDALAVPVFPSATDLDAVAEEETARKRTRGKKGDSD
jgi:hypothetical protein